MDFHGVVNAIHTVLRGSVEMELSQLEHVILASPESAGGSSRRKLDGVTQILQSSGRGRVRNGGVQSFGIL